MNAVARSDSKVNFNRDQILAKSLLTSVHLGPIHYGKNVSLKYI
jgi:hypothetical protein